MNGTRREAVVKSGPHSGQVLVAELDEKGSVIAVLYNQVGGHLEFVADYWFETFEDMQEAFEEMEWHIEWRPELSLGAMPSSAESLLISWLESAAKAYIGTD